MKAEVTTTSSLFPGNEMLGTQDRVAYYLKIATPKGHVVLNVGKGTVDKLQAIYTNEEETIREEPQPGAESTTGDTVDTLANRPRRPRNGGEANGA